MRDRMLVLAILKQILEATATIASRLSGISSADNLTATAAGREKLDAICLPLCAIGESLKKIDRLTDGNLLPAYPAIDWSGAKAMRDVIAHQYFDIDAEIVFDVCTRLLPQLAETIRIMILDIAKNNI